MPSPRDSASGGGSTLLNELLERCSFPTRGTAVDCAFSGGADSTALLILAQHAGLLVTAHHVDHGLRAESADDARAAAAIAETLDVTFVLHQVDIDRGSNLEARARAARRTVLPTNTMTGHTADDQAETVIVRLLRGSGSTGLAAIEPGPAHPILSLRRAETVQVCAAHGIQPVHDASNDLLDVWRNRVRVEILPLMNDIAGREVAPILGRTADLLREESAYLDCLALDVDPTDARSLSESPPVLARRALRRWLTEAGYPPDSAAIERVVAVARGDTVACELAGGRRVERSKQRLRIVEP